MLNYGVAGGQLIPIAKINLHSNKLQLTLHDETQNRQTQLTRTTQTVTVAMLRHGHCSGGNANYAFPKDMVALCDTFLKNQEVLSCKQQ